jgi:hypothetical protein
VDRQNQVDSNFSLLMTMEENFLKTQTLFSQLQVQLHGHFKLKREMTEEAAHLRFQVNELNTTNHALRQEINRACIAHTHTRNILEHEKMQLRQALGVASQKQYQHMVEYAARLAAEDCLEISRQECNRLATELHYAQQRLRLVDVVVDLGVFGDDSELDNIDHSREVTGVILDLETRYRKTLQEKNQRILQLERASALTPSSTGEPIVYE